MFQTIRNNNVTYLLVYTSPVVLINSGRRQYLFLSSWNNRLLIDLWADSQGYVSQKKWLCGLELIIDPVSTHSGPYIWLSHEEKENALRDTYWLLKEWLLTCTHHQPKQPLSLPLTHVRCLRFTGQENRKSRRAQVSCPHNDVLDVTAPPSCGVAISSRRTNRGTARWMKPSKGCFKGLKKGWRRLRSETSGPISATWNWVEILNSEHVTGNAELAAIQKVHSNASFGIIKSGLIAEYFVKNICFSCITLAVPSHNIQRRKDKCLSLIETCASEMCFRTMEVSMSWCTYGR